jgi:hypothetical protein
MINGTNEDGIPPYICIATRMNVFSSSIVIFSGATVYRASEINDVVAVPSSWYRDEYDNGKVNQEHDSQYSSSIDHRYHTAMILLPPSKV